MTDRIRKVLQIKKLSPSVFADKVGVPRSTISHVLSGRNNPSLEFIQKILDHFPDIRTEWLVRGEGSMLKQSGTLFAEEEPQESLSFSIPTKPEQPAEKAAAVHSPHRENISAPHTRGKETADSEEVGQSDQIAEVLASGGVNKDKVVIEGAKNSKKTARIMIFFTDGTFQEYLPSQDD